MIVGFLLLCIIWLMLSAFGILFGMVYFPNVLLTDIKIVSMTVSWFVAFFIVMIHYHRQGRIHVRSLEDEDDGDDEELDYGAHMGGFANRVVGKSARGGHLYFFPDMLVFHPNPTPGQQTKDWKLAYRDIAAVTLGKTEKSICITSKKGKVDYFFVSRRAQWVNGIEARRSRAV